VALASAMCCHAPGITWRRPLPILVAAAGSALRAVVAQAEPSCPAGPAGDRCRQGWDDEEVAGAASSHSWKAFEGCAIPAGNDVGEPQLLTVDEARRRCGMQPRCQGFTFAGTDPEGPLSGSAVWVHMKEKFDCISAEWIAYRKLQTQHIADAPAAPPSPPPPPEEDEEESLVVAREGQGVALCLNGQVRMLQTTAAALQQNLLAVLQPDMFMYGPRDPSFRDDSPELFGLEEYLAAARWEDEDIRTKLYSDTRNPGRTIDLEYLEVQGNWFGNQCLRPALRDNRPGSAICMYYNQQKCMEMIQEHEQERGKQYEWVVVSRTDFRWLAPHPPLELLDKKDAVWIPSGSDWEGGINDRHVVMRRRHAEAYMSGWQLITQAKAKDVMLETLGSMKVMGYPGPNTENFLKARLLYYDLPVERFPNVAYLTCTQRVKSRWTQCSGTMSNDAPGWLYKEEMEHATRVAQCVRSSWSARKMSDCWDEISHLYRGIR